MPFSSRNDNLNRFAWIFSYSKMMFPEMTAKEIRLFNKEQRQLNRHRGNYILSLAVLLFLGFSPLDYFLVPALFLEFFQYRLTFIVFALFFLYLNQRDVDLHYTYGITFAAYILALLTIDLMVIRMGGVGSPYFAGFIVTIVLFAAMTPLAMTQALLSGFLAIVLYLSSVMYCGLPMDGQGGTTLLHNVFFLTSFILLVSIQSGYETQARQKNFCLRQQEEKAARKLDQQAEALEAEVIERYREHQRTENRFRRLFEYIVDDVILVKEDGGILYANPPFFNHLKMSQNQDCNLLDFVAPEEREGVKQELLAPVARGEIVSGYQLKLIPMKGAYIETEINGGKLERQGQLLGLQLSIRDISTRKHMEQKLRQSLLEKKQIENAAILALARLSEHRDLTPHRHLERMREYSRLLTEELYQRPEYHQGQLGNNTVADVAMASILHDIGKVGIPDRVLFATETLMGDDMDSIRQHPIFGGDVIKAMESSEGSSGFLQAAKNIAYFHHEKWNGSGYPFGLVGEEIPLVARIVALADAYESMTSPKVFREQSTHKQAMQEIILEKGRHFDPAVVDAFLAREKEFNTIRHTLRGAEGMERGRM